MTPLFKKPKYSTIKGVSANATRKKEIPEGLWLGCRDCGEVVHRDDLENNLNVCPKCNFHNPLNWQGRVSLLTDEGTFEQFDTEMSSVDKLQFTGTASYQDKIDSNQAKTAMKDAVVCGTAALDGRPMALAVMDFRFLGASMGSEVSEKITRLAETATERKLPLIMVTASGGARMYEGLFSLMQMAKTSGAVGRHGDAGLPYIVIIAHPTTGGVTASFASLGDVILAEPGALIGFAGPRVIKQTTQAELPAGFQTAEFLLTKGFIDRIVPRHEMRRELSLLLEYVK